VLTSVVTSVLDAAANRAAKALGADGAVADYSRGVGTQAVVVPVDANRDDADLAGHRATELTFAARTA
jgi:imidazole glycerol phosphate synthase subunit HisF